MVYLKMVLTPATQTIALKSAKPIHFYKVCKKKRCLKLVNYFLVSTRQKASHKSKAKLAFVRGE